MTGLEVVGLTAIEESILTWERASVPWAIHYDVAAGRLDADRLRTAWNAALAHHEMGGWAVGERPGGVEWVPSAVSVDIGPVEVVRSADDHALHRLRVTLLDRPQPLDRAPLGRTVITRGPQGDVLMSSHSHVLSDAIGGLRLLRSVAHTYAGEDDPPPAVDIAAARRVLTAGPPTGLDGLVRRWATGARMAAATVLPRARVAPRGGGGTGFGVVMRTVPNREVKQARKRLDASFDELLIAALHVAIGRWNAEAGLPDERVGTAFGVNLRSPEWVLDVVANLAAFISVLTEPGQHDDLATALATVRPQLAPEERLDRAGVATQLAGVSTLVPLAMRQQLLTASAPSFYDSISVSNLGKVADPPTFDPEVPGDVWASPPAIPAVGLGILVATTDKTVRLTTRYRRERFDDDGARAFTDAVADCLVGS